VRGVACRIGWPTRKSSKKLPARVLSISTLQEARGGAATARGRGPSPERDRWARAGLLLAGLLLAAPLAGCGPRDDSAERRGLCERALEALEPGARVLRAEEAGREGRLTLRFATADGEDADALACRFGRDEAGRLSLAGLATGREGELSPSALFLLQTYALARDGAAAGPGLGAWPYLAQQALNALGPASIYALLALGYSLLYGLIGRVNLAFGEFCALGTYAALAGALLAGGGTSPGAGAALGAVAAVLPLGLALGAATHALVLRPLLRRTSLAFLVATLGLSLALGEAMRVTQGNRTQWLPPGLAAPLTLWRAEGGGAAVAVSTGQLLLAALAVAAFALVLAGLRRTAFGRAWRACSDDMEAAALVGVDVDRTVLVSAMLAGACAALAGAAVALHYGVVGPDAGLMLGFKALTAAVVGGIGSPAGAALGGALIGLAETFWAAYLPAEWRDVVIFGVLAFALTLRPHGILGAAYARDNPALWRGRA
jgi:branched-chain amino acid transport system permease protein